MRDGTCFRDHLRTTLKVVHVTTQGKMALALDGALAKKGFNWTVLAVQYQCLLASTTNCF